MQLTVDFYKVLENGLANGPVLFKIKKQLTVMLPCPEVQVAK